MNLDDTYAKAVPDEVAAPALLAWNSELAAELGLDTLADDDAELARIFSGAATPAGFKPKALAYAGHQFGHFVPQLGDGRARPVHKYDRRMSGQF